MWSINNADSLQSTVKNKGQRGGGRGTQEVSISVVGFPSSGLRAHFWFVHGTTWLEPWKLQKQSLDIAVFTHKGCGKVIAKLNRSMRLIKWMNKKMTFKKNTWQYLLLSSPTGEKQTTRRQHKGSESAAAFKFGKRRLHLSVAFEGVFDLGRYWLSPNQPTNAALERWNTAHVLGALCIPEPSSSAALYWHLTEKLHLLLMSINQLQTFAQ